MNSLIVWLLSWLSFHTSSGVAQSKSWFALARGVLLVSIPHDHVVCRRGVVRGPNDGLRNQTGRTSNSSKTTETKGHGSKPLVSRIG